MSGRERLEGLLNSHDYPEKVEGKRTRTRTNIKSLAKPLANLFSMSFSQGVVPKEWKCEQVIPVYKSGGKSDPNNYRPISLLPIISKIMESIVNDQLRKHLFGLSLITSNQYGFRPGHSTLV